MFKSLFTLSAIAGFIALAMASYKPVQHSYTPEAMATIDALLNAPPEPANVKQAYLLAKAYGLTQSDIDAPVDIFGEHKQ